MLRKTTQIVKDLSNKAFILVKFVGFILRAKTVDQLDSPYLYAFYRAVIGGTRRADPKIELYRKDLLSDLSILGPSTHGVGSTIFSKSPRTVRSLAHHSSSPLSKCILLKNLIAHLSPSSILELGSGLGLSALYLSLSDVVDIVDTVEGNQSRFEYIHSKVPAISSKIRMHHMEFAWALKNSDRLEKSYNCIFVDGDHSFQSQVLLYPSLLKRLTDRGVLIYDDLYLNKDMYKFWSSVHWSNRFNVRIDLFHFGVLLNNPEIKESLDVKINPSKVRWKLGIFR